MGGCLLTDNLSWASVMLSYNACPPDPEIVGERWREMWMERLESSGLWIRNWLEHQRRGDWRVMAVTRTILTSTPSSFRICATVDAQEGDKRVFSKNWDEVLLRDHI